MLNNDAAQPDGPPPFENETERRAAIRQEIQRLGPSRRIEAINRIRAIEGRAPITEATPRL